MTLQPKTFNTRYPMSNIRMTDAGKPGGSALNACSRDSGVECSMFRLRGPAFALRATARPATKPDATLRQEIKVRSAAGAQPGRSTSKS